MKHTAILASLVVILSAIIFMPSIASDMKEKMNEQLIIAGTNGAAIDPLVTKLSPDGSIILAGYISATKNSWAAKLNANHTIAWTYTGTLSPEDGDSELKNTLSGPQFRDVVPMPDGSVFLCGEMAHSVHSAQSTALLTHLNQQGDLISEQLVDIQDADEPRHLFSIATCTSFKGGILALAQEIHFHPPFSKPDAFSASFALLQFDATGRLTKKHRFNPVGAMFQPVPGGSKLTILNNAFIVVTTNNVNTEITAFAFDGKRIAGKTLNGRYITVQNSGSDLVRIYGSSESGGAGLKTMMTLNNTLDEVEKKSGVKPASFVPHLVFELPDHEFAMFGTQINSFGDRLTSSVRRVSANLETERTIEIPHQGFFDGGAILAATPTSTQGEFTIARSYAPQGVTPYVQRGALVHVMKF